MSEEPRNDPGCEDWQEKAAPFYQEIQSAGEEVKAAGEKLEMRVIATIRARKQGKSFKRRKENWKKRVKGNG